jgi:hypothetical protein
MSYAFTFTCGNDIKQIKIEDKYETMNEDYCKKDENRNKDECKPREIDAIIKKEFEVKKNDIDPKKIELSSLNIIQGNNFNDQVKFIILKTQDDKYDVELRYKINKIIVNGNNADQSSNSDQTYEGQTTQGQTTQGQTTQGQTTQGQTTQGQTTQGQTTQGQTTQGQNNWMKLDSAKFLLLQDLLQNQFGITIDRIRDSNHQEVANSIDFKFSDDTKACATGPEKKILQILVGFNTEYKQTPLSSSER